MTRRIFAILPVALFAAAADAPTLTALDSMQPGLWALSSRDSGFAKHSICLGDPRALIQIRQPSAVCSRFVIASDAASATVHYTCPGLGHGRTTIRVETARLAQVETQGIVGKAPFDMTIEARRTGACPALSMR